MPLEMQVKIKALLGIREGETNSDAAIAMQCAWDMGYREVHAIVTMVRKLLTPPLSE